MAYVSHEILISCGGIDTVVGCAMQWTHPKLVNGREGFIRATIMWSGFVCESRESDALLQISDDGSGGRVVDLSPRLANTSVEDSRSAACGETTKLTQLLNMEAGLNLPRMLIQRAYVSPALSPLPSLRLLSLSLSLSLSLCFSSNLTPSPLSASTVGTSLSIFLQP